MIELRPDQSQPFIQLLVHFIVKPFLELFFKCCRLLSRHGLVYLHQLIILTFIYLVDFLYFTPVLLVNWLIVNCGIVQSCNRIVFATWYFTWAIMYYRTNLCIISALRFTWRRSMWAYAMLIFMALLIELFALHHLLLLHIILRQVLLIL